MAINLVAPTDLAAVKGVRLGTSAAGIKRADRDDLLLIEIAPGSVVGAVFTQSSFRAAPVAVSAEHLQSGAPRALLVNSGNANAATGEQGVANARETCAYVAQQLGCRPEQVLPFSTGVIGVHLPVAKIAQSIPNAANVLSDGSWESAARAIMTTNTVPKARSVRFDLDGHACSVTGICKGAGMIRPDMATMLAFVATDAAVDGALLQRMTRQIAERSFNRVTVDGDTSTNDSFVIVATGQSGAPVVADASDSSFAPLYEALEGLCVWLAQAIIRDAEGATRFVGVSVRGGETESECLKVAYAIAESPLVKTAMFAGDANWGRLCMAIGKAGVDQLDVARVAVWLDDVQVAVRGMIHPDYSEGAGAAVMAKNEYTIAVDLGRGSATDTVWTCDFSYDYVKINAEYRT